MRENSSPQKPGEGPGRRAGRRFDRRAGRLKKAGARKRSGASAQEARPWTCATRTGIAPSPLHQTIL